MNQSNNHHHLDADQMIRVKGYPINGDTIAGNNNNLTGDNDRADSHYGDNHFDIKAREDSLFNEDQGATSPTSSVSSIRETIFQDVPDLFDSLAIYLSSPTNQISDNQLLQQLIVSLNSLKLSFNIVLDLSQYYEYKSLPANGYITYCVMVRSWLSKVNSQLGLIKDDESSSTGPGKRDKTYFTDTLIVLRGFNQMKDLLVHLHETHDPSSPPPGYDQATQPELCSMEKASSPVRERPMFSPNIEETIYQLDHCFASNEFQEAIIRSFNLFWLPSRTRLIMKMYQKGVSWTYADFLSSWKVLTSRAYRSKTFVEMANRANMGFPFDIAGLIDSHLSRKVCANVFYRNRNAIGSNIWVPRQGTWFVPDHGPGIVEHNPPYSNRPLIRCRFVRHRTLPVRDEVLIFHCHGSGFILSRPDVHDGYLKPWVARLEGVSVLSVDYSLMAKYPQQFQDVLDAYLWVTSGHESVVEKIGFHPKKVILIGDSAGSMLAMSLPLLLHEIQKKIDSKLEKNGLYNNNLFNETGDSLYPVRSVNMPKAFISFYGTFHLTGAWSASRVMTVFDPILHYGNVLAIAGCLSGLQGRIDEPIGRPKKRLSKVSSFIAEDMRIVKRSLKPRSIYPWYLDDNGKVNGDQFRRIYSILQSPYLNCPSFTDFEALRDVSLCLVTSFACTFLDDNIELARAWKGPCEVHVLEGQIHGFLFMRHEKAAIEFADDKIVQFVRKFLDSEESNSS